MGTKFTYRFKVTSNRNNSVLGTGIMTSEKILNDSEQLQLFHNMSHGVYLNQTEMVTIEIILQNQPLNQL